MHGHPNPGSAAARPARAPLLCLHAGGHSVGHHQLLGPWAQVEQHIVVVVSACDLVGGGVPMMWVPGQDARIECPDRVGRTHSGGQEGENSRRCIQAWSQAGNPGMEPGMEPGRLPSSPNATLQHPARKSGV